MSSTLRGFMHMIQFILTPFEVLLSPLMMLGVMVYHGAFVPAYASQK